LAVDPKGFDIVRRGISSPIQSIISNKEPMMRRSCVASAAISMLGILAFSPTPVAAHTGNTLAANCEANRFQRLDTQSELMLEMKCFHAGNMVLRVRTEGDAERMELFLDPAHTSVLDRPMHFALQDDELTVMQSIHRPVASGKAIPGGVEWTIRLPERTGRVIGLGVSMSTSQGDFSWPGSAGMSGNRRKLGDLMLLNEGDRVASLSGTVEWTGGRDLSPPMRVVARSSDARIEGPVEGDGSFRLRLPAGDYAVFALDSRIGLKRSTVSINVGDGEDANLDSPVVAQTASEPLRELIPAILDRAGIKAAAVAVVKDGNPVFAESYGVELDGAPAGAQTLFGMESVTKTVTAMTMISLAERGLLDLDERLAKYWVDPDLANDPRHFALTFRMALRHLTTLPNWRGEEQLAFAGELGSAQSYSGEAYEYARRALIRKFNASLQELAGEYVFGPADTQAMSFLWPADGDEHAAGFHFGDYAFDFDKPTEEASAASDLVATAADLGQYAAWLANGAGLSPTSWARVLTPNPETLRKEDDNSQIGEGFFVFDPIADGKLPIFGHGGSAMGARTLIVVDPEARDAVVIATSSGAGLALIRAVVEAAFKRGAEMPLLEEELSSWEWYDY
jgi:CubicO group peptidase (beta-lactamase class C family)